jgi:hypothetical protein
MNAEIQKRMNKIERKNALREWWKKNKYKVLRAILFPIWFTYTLVEKRKNKLYRETQWNEERANEILTRYIAKDAEWNNESKTFYFFDNGMGWGMKFHQKKIKRKDRRFWRKFIGAWGGDIRKHLIEKFELEGFEKELGNCSDGWTEITFRLIEK